MVLLPAGRPDVGNRAGHLGREDRAHRVDLVINRSLSLTCDITETLNDTEHSLGVSSPAPTFGSIA